MKKIGKTGIPKGKIAKAKQGIKIVKKSKIKNLKKVKHTKSRKKNNKQFTKKIKRTK